MPHTLALLYNDIYNEKLNIVYALFSFKNELFESLYKPM